MKQKRWYTPEETRQFNVYKENLISKRKKIFREVPDSELMMLTVQFAKTKCQTYQQADKMIKHFLHWIPFVAVVEEPKFNENSNEYKDGNWSLHLHLLILKKHCPKHNMKDVSVVATDIYDLDKLCGYLSKQYAIWHQGPILNFPKKFHPETSNQLTINFD